MGHGGRTLHIYYYLLLIVPGCREEANAQVIDLLDDAVYRSYTTKEKAEAAFEKAQSLGVVRVLRDE